MSTATRPLVLSGFGVACALAPDFAALRQALQAREQAYRLCEEMIGADFNPVITAFRDWPLDLPVHERLERLMAEAFADPMLGALETTDRAALGLVLCLPEDLDATRDRPLLDALMAKAQALLGARAGAALGPIARREMVLGGHAGAATGLALAARWLAAGECRHVVLVAADSYAPRRRLAGLVDQNRLFNNSSNRWGLVPGEAAAVLHLTAGAGPVLLAAAEAFEPVGEEDDAVTRSDALSQAAVAALDATGANTKIGHWYADLNNARYRASEAMIVAQRLRFRHRLEEAEIDTLTPFIGDIGAASLPVQLLLAGERVRAAAGRVGLATAGSRMSKLRGAATIWFARG